MNPIRRVFIVTQHAKYTGAQEKQYSEVFLEFEINFIMIYVKSEFWQASGDCVRGVRVKRKPRISANKNFLRMYSRPSLSRNAIALLQEL